MRAFLSFVIFMIMLLPISVIEQHYNMVSYPRFGDDLWATICLLCVWKAYEHANAKIKEIFE